MMGRLQVICTMDQIKEAKRNVQKYMRKHKSDEDFIDNISDDFVMGFMISQRMVWDDYDNGTQRENDNFGKWIPCSERIPEEPKENLVFDGKCLEVYLVSTKYGSSDQDKVYPFRAFWNGINFTDGWGILDVIAWMPLPEPYKEAEDE